MQDAKPTYPQSLSFSSDFGHLILKMLENVNFIHRYVSREKRY